MRDANFYSCSAKYASVLGFVKLVKCDILFKLFEIGLLNFADTTFVDCICACLIQGNPVRECEQRQFFPDTVGHEHEIDYSRHASIIHWVGNV